MTQTQKLETETSAYKTIEAWKASANEEFGKGVACAAAFILSGNIVSSVANGLLCVEVLREVS